MKTIPRISVPVKTFAIFLTWAEHDMLRWREDKANSFKGTKEFWIGDILRFKGAKYTSITSWDDHSGTLLQVNVHADVEDAFIACVDRLSAPNEIYLDGLKQGEAGGDLRYPKGMSAANQKLLESGFDRGLSMGKKTALTTGMTGTGREWIDCQVLIER